MPITPNAALANAALCDIRKALEHAREVPKGSDEELMALRQLAQYVEVMDVWLSKGGVFPRGWLLVDRRKLYGL